MGLYIGDNPQMKRQANTRERVKASARLREERENFGDKDFESFGLFWLKGKERDRVYPVEYMMAYLFIYRRKSLVNYVPNCTRFLVKLCAL